MKSELAGRFRLVAHKPDGSSRVLADWFDNLVLDTGLARIGSGAFWSICRVGTGTTAPLATDTALQAVVASTNTIQSTANGAAASAPYYWWNRKTYRFATGAAAGNLSEVGVGWTLGGTDLFSRALIKDGGGNPTTVTVLSDETLDVTYELRSYAQVDDAPFSVDISGTTYTGVVRAAQVLSAITTLDGAIDKVAWWSTYNGAIGAATSLPSGSQSSITSGYSAGAYTYSGGVHSRQISATVDLNTGNLSGGISALYLPTTMGRFQASFSPAIPKDGTKTLTLTFEFQWGRRAS